MLRFGIPVLFVLIWSTGFIVARHALPHADLQLFVLVRLSLTAALTAMLAQLAGVAWPRGSQMGFHIGTGALLQGVYLSFSYWAITNGMAAGVMALLGALQPLFTAMFVAASGKKLGSRTWTGLIIGFAGVACVLSPKLMQSSGSLPILAVGAALVSIMSVTAGSLLQKWLAPVDLRSAASIQNLGGVAIALLMTILAGTGHWDGSLALWAALGWSVIAASVIGMSLLMWMMRHGEATKVAALILLVPPLAALQAYFFFHETLSPLQLTGFALALGGVLLTRSARGSKTA